jgi:hypothetical protein
LLSSVTPVEFRIAPNACSFARRVMTDRSCSKKLPLSRLRVRQAEVGTARLVRQLFVDPMTDRSLSITLHNKQLLLGTDDSDLEPRGI